MPHRRGESRSNLRHFSPRPRRVAEIEQDRESVCVIKRESERAREAEGNKEREGEREGERWGGGQREREKERERAAFAPETAVRTRTC